MNCGEIIPFLSPVGLLLDVIGAILIYLYGLPEEISRKGTVYIVAEEVDDSEKIKVTNYDRKSKIGFYFLIIGFLLQFLSALFYSI